MTEKETKALIALRVYGKSLSDEDFLEVTNTIKELIEEKNKRIYELEEEKAEYKKTIEKILTENNLIG